MCLHATQHVSSLAAIRCDTKNCPGKNAHKRHDCQKRAELQEGTKIYSLQHPKSLVQLSLLYIAMAFIHVADVWCSWYSRGYYTGQQGWVGKYTCTKSCLCTCAGLCTCAALATGILWERKNAQKSTVPVNTVGGSLHFVAYFLLHLTPPPTLLVDYRCVMPFVYSCPTKNYGTICVFESIID